MIVVRGIPVYWGIETEAVDKSFLTQATLHEVLPPFRQSIWAFRLRVTPWHWLHLGLFRYEREARRWDLDITPDEIGYWGRRNRVEEEDAEGSPDALEVQSIRPIGSDRLVGSDDDAEWGTVQRAESFRTGSGVGAGATGDADSATA